MLKQTPAENKLRVSFDLDETLFVDPSNHKTEPPLRGPIARIYQERLRLGTVELVRRLQQEGFEVWIYTSSFRSERYINGLFRHYGIRFDGIVNGERHQREIQANSRDPVPTKLPNRYRITLHVDDEAIVATYGRTFGFQVYQLDAQDDEWAEKILARVRAIRDAGHPADRKR